MTRVPYTDAQQSTIAVSTASRPKMFVNVSFMPANEASALSSPVADDRTATCAGPCPGSAVALRRS
jgi:hypothetical protein